jgi:hypothetical protein
MSGTLVQQVKGNGGGYQTLYTFSVTPTVGNFLQLNVGCGDVDYLTVTDDKGNTWNADKTQTLTGERKINMLKVFNCAGGATVVSLKFKTDLGADQYSDSAYILTEFSGIPTTDPIDQTVGGTTTAGTSFASGNTATTTQANELIVGAVCVTESTTTPGTLVYTGDAGYSTVVYQPGFDQYTSIAFQYKSVSATGAQSITMTTNNSKSGSTAIATYKEVVSSSVNSGFFQLL